MYPRRFSANQVFGDAFILTNSPLRRKPDAEKDGSRDGNFHCALGFDVGYRVNQPFSASWCTKSTKGCPQTSRRPPKPSPTQLSLATSHSARPPQRYPSHSKTNMHPLFCPHCASQHLIERRTEAMLPPPQRRFPAGHRGRGRLTFVSRPKGISTRTLLSMACYP